MASPLPGSGFWAGRHDTKQPPSWSAGGHGATSMCHDAPGLIPPAVLPSAKWHWIRPAMPTPLLSRIGLVRCSHRPQRTERTPADYAETTGWWWTPRSPRQTTRRDRPQGRVPTLSCCRTYLVAGPLADATGCVFGPVERLAEE